MSNLPTKKLPPSKDGSNKTAGNLATASKLSGGEKTVKSDASVDKKASAMKLFEATLADLGTASRAKDYADEARANRRLLRQGLLSGHFLMLRNEGKSFNFLCIRAEIVKTSFFPDFSPPPD